MYKLKVEVLYMDYVVKIGKRKDAHKNDPKCFNQRLLASISRTRRQNDALEMSNDGKLLEYRIYVSLEDRQPSNQLLTDGLNPISLTISVNIVYPSPPSSEIKPYFDLHMDTFPMLELKEMGGRQAMHDLKAYQKLHGVVIRDVTSTLQTIPFKWKEGARIMDIGCGDGSVTIDVWKKYMPKSFMKIVGCDKNLSCVDFASENYASERVQFIRLDIEEEIPKELKSSFDHVISSYTFHWVNMQETAFSNVYNLLADGGSCLLIFLGYFKPYENYRNLSRMPKWSADLEDVSTKFMSPYHDSQDPENEIIRIMHRVGFRDINVNSHHKTFKYVRGVDDFKLLMKCLNPFDSLKAKWEDFMDDYVKLDPDAGTSVYQLLVVYGAK